MAWRQRRRALCVYDACTLFTAADDTDNEVSYVRIVCAKIKGKLHSLTHPCLVHSLFAARMLEIIDVAWNPNANGGNGIAHTEKQERNRAVVCRRRMRTTPHTHSNIHTYHILNISHIGQTTTNRPNAASYIVMTFNSFSG